MIHAIMELPIWYANIAMDPTLMQVILVSCVKGKVVVIVNMMALHAMNAGKG